MPRTITISDIAYDHIQAHKKNCIEETGIALADNEVLEMTFALLGILAMTCTDEFSDAFKTAFLLTNLMKEARKNEGES